MAVYYKFKSARDFHSISVDGPFISLGVLKEKIFESKHLGRGTDHDLVVTNAQTNEEYLDEATLIPKNTSVLVRRVPGRPRLPIVTEQEAGSKVEDTKLENSSFSNVDLIALKDPEDSVWDEFGHDLYDVSDTLPVQSFNSLPDVLPTSKADEDSKIKALIETPALDWQRQGSDGYVPGRGFGRSMTGRMGGRGFGRLGLERKTPPHGYVCHRCKVPGHFIQHCPTNGDPNFDVKRVKPPTGIPKSMLMASQDGSYALPSGAVAVLRPNEAAFEKEIEGLPSTRSVGDLPPELHCPLCNEVMKDAVLTSKCCFKSFCDKCIRDHIVSKAMCVCGAMNILADDLLPNKTLRDTINRILESGNSSTENAGSTFQVQDMESARCPQPRIPSPTMSVAFREEKNPVDEEIPVIKETIEEEKAVIASQQVSEKMKIAKVADVSEATSMSVKEPASQGSAPLAEEEVQQKMAFGEAGKKKKRKKVRLPTNDLQWKTSQDYAAENYMMPMGPSAYNPYWAGIQPGMEYMAPYPGPMPYIGYGLGPLDMPFGGVMPPDPFGAQGLMFPAIPPHRDLAELGMGMNTGPPIMSREEFEARKADLRRKRENERRAESREFSRDREFSREWSSGGDVPSMKSKANMIPQTSGGDHHPHRYRSERSSADPLPPPPRPSKRKSEHQNDRDRDHDDYHDRENDNHRHHHHSSKPSSEPTTKQTSTTTKATTTTTETDNKKHKASVFSRISFPEGESDTTTTTTKKRKPSSSTEAPPASSTHRKVASSNGYYEDYKPMPSSSSKVASVSSGGGRKSGSVAVDYESSDEDRHFKRKPSRYEPSPPPPDWEEEPRPSRGSRERDRDYYSKHR
ncbi:DWNN domain-containing protein [Cephalotus follicularis]|uniref:DWNN domain-containing protein n=1 Tax=Cephalotus follicularis TaxID=3775 RepID=A0A1Q3BY61_CEPFO|nr:DWNN domain-containing protein [Cephalotus follicularis]